MHFANFKVLEDCISNIFCPGVCMRIMARNTTLILGETKLLLLKD